MQKYNILSVIFAFLLALIVGFPATAGDGWDAGDWRDPSAVAYSYVGGGTGVGGVSDTGDVNTATEQGFATESWAKTDPNRAGANAELAQEAGGVATGMERAGLALEMSGETGSFAYKGKGKPEAATTETFGVGLVDVAAKGDQTAVVAVVGGSSHQRSVAEHSRPRHSGSNGSAEQVTGAAGRASAVGNDYAGTSVNAGTFSSAFSRDE